MKGCRKCGEVKPLVEFRHDRRTADGLAKSCDDCSPYSKRWEDGNREKVAAHNEVHKAVMSGRLAKEPCEVCGESLAVAHHDDYTLPLVVRWLCPQHHADHHKQLRKISCTKQ